MRQREVAYVNIIMGEFKLVGHLHNIGYGTQKVPVA
jgi:hypothetical protein